MLSLLLHFRSFNTFKHPLPVNTTPISWRLLHESPPLRGASYTSLPAQVMEVSESCLYGIYCVQMFYGLGCTHTYRILRRNCTYVCVEEGLEIMVSWLVDWLVG